MQRGLFLAFMIHGMYDFALFSVPVVGSILPALMVFPLLRWCYNKLQILIKDAIEEDSQMGRIDTPIVTVADTDTENDLMNIPPLPPEDFIDT